MLLSRDSRLRIREGFEVDKLIHPLLACETGCEAEFVLVHPPLEIVGDTDVKRLVPVGHYVDVELSQHDCLHTLALQRMTGCYLQRDSSLRSE